MSPPRKKPLKLEEPEQIYFFSHVEILYSAKALSEAEYRLTYSVNSAGIRHISHAVRMKRMGIRKGTPDIHVDVPRQGYHGLKIELKAPIIKGLGKPSVSTEQKHMIELYLSEGYLATVCYGYREAIKVYLNYLGIEHHYGDKR
jgi:hypothetical protein